MPAFSPRAPLALFSLLALLTSTSAGASVEVASAHAADESARAPDEPASTKAGAPATALESTKPASSEPESTHPVAEATAPSAATNTTSTEPRRVEIEPRRVETEPRHDEIAPTSSAPTVGMQQRGFAQRAFGARGGFIFPGADAQEGPFAGASLYERAVGVLSVESISARYMDELWIGGDGRDFSYAASLQGSVGPRLRLGESFSLLARAHLRASIRQEGGLYLSSLRLPGAEAGFSVESNRIDLEWIGHAAPLLTGNWSRDGVSVPLGGSAFGSSMSVSVLPLRLDLDMNYYIENSSQWVVLETRGHVCFLWGKKKQLPAYRTGDARRAVHVGPRAVDYTWSMCGDFGNVRAENWGRRADLSSTWMAGVSLLIGSFSVLDPAPGP